MSFSNKKVGKFIEDKNNPIIQEILSVMKKKKTQLNRTHFEPLADWTIYDLLTDLGSLKIQ